MESDALETRLGLDALVELLTHRYESNGLGRLIQDRAGGVPPRFIFGRTAEGCLWRFAADLEPERVAALAKLAARERGWPDAGVETPSPPERLVMMARLLGEPDGPAESKRETLEVAGTFCAEFWIFAHEA